MCRSKNIEATISPTYFGKLVKRAFPEIKYNRKGPRGGTKQHYTHLKRINQNKVSLERQIQVMDKQLQQEYSYYYTINSQKKVEISASDQLAKMIQLTEALAKNPNQSGGPEQTDRTDNGRRLEGIPHMERRDATTEEVDYLTCVGPLVGKSQQQPAARLAAATASGAMSPPPPSSWVFSSQLPQPIPQRSMSPHAYGHPSRTPTPPLVPPLTPQRSPSPQMFHPSMSIMPQTLPPPLNLHSPLPLHGYHHLPSSYFLKPLPSHPHLENTHLAHSMFSDKANMHSSQMESGPLPPVYNSRQSPHHEIQHHKAHMQHKYSSSSSSSSIEEKNNNDFSPPNSPYSKPSFTSALVSENSNAQRVLITIPQPNSPLPPPLRVSSLINAQHLRD